MHYTLNLMIKKNGIIKAGILSTFIAFATGSILVVGGFSAQQYVFARGLTVGGGGHGVTGVSGGMAGMGGDAGIGTSGGTCNTPNCNANGASANGAPGTPAVPGTGAALPVMFSPISIGHRH
jgi:hypothetical protein